MRTKISFIFPIYVVDRANERIQNQCFDSFLRYTPKPYELIIIDNGSKFGSERAKGIADVYIRTERPIGYAKAVNMGWEIAKGEIFGCLNNDVVLKKDWLPPLLEALEDPSVVAVAPADKKFTGIREEIWPHVFLIKKKVQRQIGLFDSTYLPFRFHDQDYWIRAKNLGLRFIRVGQSVIGYHVSTTFNKMPKKYWYILKEDMLMRLRWGVAKAEDYSSDNTWLDNLFIFWRDFFKVFKTISKL